MENTRERKLEIVTDFLQALRALDQARLQTLMCDDVIWEIPRSSPPPFGGRHQGREKVLGMLETSLFLPDSGGVVIDDLLVEGERVVAEVTITGVTVKNRDYDNRYVFIITLRNEQVAEFREHLDTAYANQIFWQD